MLSVRRDYQELVEEYTLLGGPEFTKIVSSRGSCCQWQRGDGGLGSEVSLATGGAARNAYTGQHAPSYTRYHAIYRLQALENKGKLPDTTPEKPAKKPLPGSECAGVKPLQALLCECALRKHAINCRVAVMAAAAAAGKEEREYNKAVQAHEDKEAKLDMIK